MTLPVRLRTKVGPKLDQSWALPGPKVGPKLDQNLVEICPKLRFGQRFRRRSWATHLNHFWSTMSSSLVSPGYHLVVESAETLSDASHRIGINSLGPRVWGLSVSGNRSWIGITTYLCLGSHLHCYAMLCIVLLYIAFQCFAWLCCALLCFALFLLCISLNCIALHHFTVLRFAWLGFALHCIALAFKNPFTIAWKKNS